MLATIDHLQVKNQEPCFLQTPDHALDGNSVSADFQSASQLQKRRGAHQVYILPNRAASLACTHMGFRKKCTYLKSCQSSSLPMTRMAGIVSTYLPSFQNSVILASRRSMHLQVTPSSDLLPAWPNSNCQAPGQHPTAAPSKVHLSARYN